MTYVAMKCKPPTASKESPVGTNASQTALRTSTQENFSHGRFPHGFVQRLHATSGNREAGRWVQAKLKIGAPNDAHELEADRMAEQVANPGSNMASLSRNSLIQPVVQRACSECDEEKKEVRAKSAHAMTSVPPSSLEAHIDAMRGTGEPLALETRQHFEQRLGVDLTDVRIHRDDCAASAAQSLNALAFTTGNDIAFAHGRYAPETAAGGKLRAHE